MIWEPFVLALVLGLIVSAGLYFAYLWPSVEPVDEPALSGTGDAATASPAAVAATTAPDDTASPAP